MDKIEKGEIVYANLVLKDKSNKIYDLRKVVFSRNWECDFPVLAKKDYNRFLLRYNIKLEEVEVIDCEIISRTGYKHKSKGYISAKKNEQIRDEVTGAYI